MQCRRELVHLCIFMVFVGVCAADKTSDTSGGKPEETYKFLTYNAALLEASISVSDTTIPNNRVGRRDALIQYLNNQSDADVVCLQEVHFGQDVEKIVNGVSMEFPYSFSLLHQSDGSLPPQSATVWGSSCGETVVSNLITCAFRAGCMSADNPSIIDVATYRCLTTSCLIEFFTLVATSDENCLACLVTNSPQNYLSRCAGAPSTGMWNMNKLGLVLLSKKNLSNTAVVDFFPDVKNIFVRGYLQATVGDNNLNVACIHAVTTTFDFPPLNPAYATFSEQHAAEIQVFVNALLDVKPLVALGDFNCGPDTNSLDPLEETNYEILTNSFTTNLVKDSTFSSQNPYNVEPDSVYEWAIDHVFSNGDAKILNTKTALKNDKRLPWPRKLPLSDHYGVKAVVKVKY